MIRLRTALRRLRLRLVPVPGQALGLAVLVAVLAAALVSAPLMVASSDEGAWEQQEQRYPPSALGTTVLGSTYTGDGQLPTFRIPEIDELDAAVTATAAESGLSAPLFLTRPRVPAATADGEAVGVVHRTGAEDHLEIVEGGPADDGVLVPQSLGLAPGASLALLSRTGSPVVLPVSGVYVTPTEPLPEWWEAQDYLFLQRYDPQFLDPRPPPAAVFAPEELALATYAELQEDVYFEWFLPPQQSAPVSDARQAADRIDEFQLRLVAPESDVDEVIRAQNFSELLVRSALPDALAVADRTVELLEPPVRAVGVGGAAAALVLVGAWTGLRVRRREDEIRSLMARGLSPLRGAADAARESLMPVLLGLAVGGLSGWLLVRRLGPSAELPTDAVVQAALLGLAGGLVVLLVVAVLTAGLVARMDGVARGQGGRILARVPWLAILAAATVVVAIPLFTGSPDDGGRLGVLPLLLPLLVTLVAAGAVTALLPRLGAVLGGRLRGLPTAGFLAVRRVFAGSGASRLVVVATALALGLVLHSGALADSTDRTIAAKASVATGSDVVVPLARTSQGTGAFASGAMLVGREGDAAVVPGDVAADVLVVHPDQVADVVRWDDDFADRSLDDLMAALADYDGDRVPVIVAGPLPESDVDLALDFTYYSLPVEVVGRADAFPGQASREPLLVADWDAYAAALGESSRVADLVLTREVWARGDRDVVVGSLTEGGHVPVLDDVTTAEDFANRPELDAQTWALGYLRAVAAAAGVLGLVGVALHALSQQRRRTAAALLLGRMGMTRRSADAAAALELGLLTLVAAIVAAAVALPSSALVLRLLDPVPSLPPDPLFAVPWTTLAAVAGGVVVVTFAGAALVGRTARRATGGQVLRDAT